MKQTNQCKGLLAMALCFLLIISCRTTHKEGTESSSAELKGKISISGAFALYPLTVAWAEAFETLHPGVTIDINAGGAGKGMVDVLSDMVDLAMFSREVSPQEEEKGAWKIAVAKDAVFPTINAENPALGNLRQHGLTREQFQTLFSGGTALTWNDLADLGSAEKINVYTRSDACGAAAMWAAWFDREQEDLKGTGVFGDPGIADAVKKDRYAVGYNNLIYIYNGKTGQVNEGLAIIPVDLNNDRTLSPEEDFYGSLESARIAIQEGKYPSPPSRNLYLISRGFPENPVIRAFLDYILNDGQQLVAKAGYVEIDEAKLQTQKDLLIAD